MKRLLLAIVLAATLISAAPARADDEKQAVDARLEGYGREVAIKNSTTGLTWLLFVFLGTITIAVLFKSGNRTHLD